MTATLLTLKSAPDYIYRLFQPRSHYFAKFAISN